MLREGVGNPATSYRKKNGLLYHINVGRNIARETANTYFIFPCDIELYPSPGARKKKLLFTRFYSFLRLIVFSFSRVFCSFSVPTSNWMLLDFFGISSQDLFLVFCPILFASLSLSLVSSNSLEENEILPKRS